MKRIVELAISLVAIMVLALSACTPAQTAAAPTSAVDKKEPTKAADKAEPTKVAENKTKYRIGTDATWPPFGSVDEKTKELVGFDIDMIKAVAEKAGFQYELINVGFDPLLAGMAQCQFDAAISTITITEDRKKSMSFSDNYFAAGQIVAVKKDNTDIKTKDDLKGKTAGAQIGTTGAIEIGKVAGATVKTYDDIGLGFQDLMNGQIDAIVADNPLVLGYVEKSPDKLKTTGPVFTDENYGIAVCKTNADLLALVNKGIAAVKADGTYDALLKKYKLESPK